MLKNRFQVSRPLLFVALAGAGAAAACGDTKEGNLVGNAGSANGGASGWTYLPPGMDVAGKAGSSNGGTAGKGGNAQGGTAGTFEPTPFACNGQQPDQPIITRFDAFEQDQWASPGNLHGGVYVYPDTLLAQVGDFLGFEDPVQTYTGVGVWFSGCIDASKFKGVRFTIHGDAGESKSVEFYGITQSNRDIDVVNGVGACVAEEPSDPWRNCRPNGYTLPVSAKPRTVSVLWSDLKGGLPNTTTDASDLIALQWSFEWKSGAPTYTAKLTIDDLEFISADDAGGDGGAGGGGAGDGAGGGGAGDGAGGGGAGDGGRSADGGHAAG